MSDGIPAEAREVLGQQAERLDRLTESLTAAILAAELAGGDEVRPTEEQCNAWKEAGLLVITGESDDNVNLFGAFDGYISAYEGATFSVTRDGMVPDEDHVDATNAHLWVARDKSIEIEALWCEGEDYSWTFKLDAPHSTFDMLDEDGAKFCRGIVIDLAGL